MRRSAVTLLLSVACTSCSPLSGEAGKLESALLAIPVGSSIKFEHPSEFAGRTICMVQPYQDSLALRHPLADQVNEYLADQGFASNEAYFSFVVVGDNEFDVVKLPRSDKLDILALHQASQLSRGTLPQGFIPRECVTGPDAAIAKIEFMGRAYIRLGQMQ